MGNNRLSEAIDKACTKVIYRSKSHKVSVNKTEEKEIENFWSYFSNCIKTNEHVCKRGVFFPRVEALSHRGIYIIMWRSTRGRVRRVFIIRPRVGECPGVVGREKKRKNEMETKVVDNREKERMSDKKMET